jgi:hypothetical protein
MPTVVSSTLSADQMVSLRCWLSSGVTWTWENSMSCIVFGAAVQPVAVS